MSVQHDVSGRRSVELEVDVPGTPEDVWRAIATGPGISCWFVLTEVEERQGGAIMFHMGAGMVSPATVTNWEPPHHFAYEERDWSGSAPPLASEWTVETHAGDTCVVRLVHSLDTESDEWDDQLEHFETGWPGCFRVLQFYLAHFRGQRCAPIIVTGNSQQPESNVWEKLTKLLGLSGAVVGQRCTTPGGGGPSYSGIVERVSSDKHLHEIMLRLEEPAPGVAILGACTRDGTVHVAISLLMYGEVAPAAAGRDEGLWHAWMNEHFPLMTK